MPLQLYLFEKRNMFDVRILKNYPHKKWVSWEVILEGFGVQITLSQRKILLKDFNDSSYLFCLEIVL